MKAFVKDGIYIPIKYVDETAERRIKKRFEKDSYVKEAVCEKCEWFGERPNDICDRCPNYGGKITMFKEVEVNDKKYIRTPFGDKASLEKIFGEIDFVDRTDDCPMKGKFEFTGALYDYQKPAVKAMLKTTGGVLKSAPRTGKTVMSTYVISKLKQKTVILASQKDWLDNFYETFVGSDEQEPVTNIKKKRIGFPKTLKECEKFDVCLFTYQKFLKPKGKKLLKKIRRMFGVMVVDEVQYASAPEFAQVINSFVCRRKYGLSGTPERKDCVSGDTVVITERGKLPIRDVLIGDRVQTRKGFREVSLVHKRPIGKMVRIAYEGGHIDCTPDHKFWVTNKTSWVKAKDLTIEDDLLPL